MNDEDPRFELSEIRDEDVCRAAILLGLQRDAFCGKNGDDARQHVIKCMDRIDVAACPGSGKTTLLVAKLAILAEKWRYRTRGLCVVSHTNAARHEIETKLGKTAFGHSLLSYPHFVGTIHSFVNEFLALPWLRYCGYPVKMIDTELCLERRWNALPRKTRIALESVHQDRSILSVKSPDLSLGDVHWRKGVSLGRNTETYKNMQAACQRSTASGCFCYEEMFVWARDLLDHVPWLTCAIRARFPLLFVDEAQDNSEEQSAILYRIFMEGRDPVIRQRFGDGNQAIFDSIVESEASTDRFPSGSIMDLPNSHRFGQKIADLADPLGIVPYGLKGQGPKEPLASGDLEGRHTVFLFSNENMGNVLDTYADLLMETFCEKELRDGVFTAVGQVHRDKGDEHKPRHVGHYWPDYDPQLANRDPKPETFVQYISAGQGMSRMASETYLVVEKTAEGILHLLRMAEGGSAFRRGRYNHRYVLQLLEEHSEAMSCYQNLVEAFSLKRESLTRETWDQHWSSVARKVAETILGSSLSSIEASAFLSWPDTPAASANLASVTERRNRDNVYRCSREGKELAIEVGSIHSVKGKTHTATLVLETFWQDKKGRHNIELLLPWLDGTRSGKDSAGVQQQTRLKLLYVAMTRPMHLLCLAMKQSTFESDPDHEMIAKLRKRGWHIRWLR